MVDKPDKVLVVIRFQICIFDILNTAKILKFSTRPML